jgi:conjugal transfer pilus assembly protein TraK
MPLKINNPPLRHALFAVLAGFLALAQADEAMPFKPVDNGGNDQSQPPQPPMMPGSGAQPPPVQAQGQAPWQAQIKGQVQQAQPQATEPERGSKPAASSDSLNTGVKRNGFGQPVTGGIASTTHAVPGGGPDKGKRLWDMAGRWPGIQPGNAVIKAKPGVTYSVTIARSVLNRITTPFEEPKSLTTESIESSVEGSSVYVATQSETPVSLFIQDSDSQKAISLRLVPVDAAEAADIRIEMDGESPQTAKLPKGENVGHPYVDELKSVMRSLALGKIPQGYSLDETPKQEGRTETCSQPNIGFALGQRLAGASMDILVMRAENTGDFAKVFDETACVSASVLAVAAWPKIRLEPHEKTEVYVAVRMEPAASAEQNRPLLINR